MSTSTRDLTGDRRSGAASPAELFEPHRRELTGYCYRMLGSSSEAEDAVQDTFTKAWRRYDGFEGRAALRTWLYRIATNVCFDMLKATQRRARPMDLQAPGTIEGPLGPPLAEQVWVMPAPDARISVSSEDPSERAVARESIRLAFVAALQFLPPRQRAVLILRDVLGLHAEEVAELLDTTVASANSALQRARATMEATRSTAQHPRPVAREVDETLLASWIEAFEAYDMNRLAALLHDDVRQSMPPYALWFQGADQVIGWMRGPGRECEGSRLVRTEANGVPALAQYRRSTRGPGHDAWSLQLIDWSEDGKACELSFFLDVEHLFPSFGLPLHLD